MWLKYGKDAVKPITVVPEYKPPTSLSPAEVGVLYDYKASNREITATLVDLAIRGFIRIYSVNSADDQTYQFELLRDDVLNLKPHEKALLNGLFGVANAKEMAHIQAELTNLHAQKQAALYPANTVSLVGKKIVWKVLDSLRKIGKSGLVIIG